MLGYEIAAKSLSRAGLTAMFGVLGDGNLHVVSAYRGLQGTRYVAARHESGAVCMANGYARAAGAVGVATVTHGPGLTNAITAITAAVTDHAPVLVVLGDTPKNQPYHAQRLDHELALATSGARYVYVDDPNRIAGALAEAIEDCESRSRPVVVNIAAEALMAEVSEDAPAVPRPTSNTAVQVAGPDPATVSAAVELMTAARRPVVLAGAGARRSAPEVAALADRLGAPVCTSLLAHGLFRSHPRDLGVAGGFSSPRTREVLAQADLLVVFGAGLNKHTRAHGALFNGVPVIQVDREPAMLGRQHPVGVGIVGDCADVARGLLAAMPESSDRVPVDLGEIAVRPEFDVEEPLDVRAEGTRRVVDPRLVLRRADELLPSERTVVTDGGHFLEWPCRNLTVPDGEGFVLAIGAGSLGLGLPAAIGAAIARPERVSVAVVGDGGLMMSLPDLESAAREHARIVVFVINDQAYGAELHKLRAAGFDESYGYFANPDFAALGTALGLDSFTVDSPDVVDEVLAQVVERVTGRSYRPCLVNVEAARSAVSARVGNPAASAAGGAA